MVEGEGQHLATRSAVARSELTVDEEPDELERKRLADRLDDARKHGVGPDRARQAPAEPRDRGIRAEKIVHLADICLAP